MELLMNVLDGFTAIVLIACGIAIWQLIMGAILKMSNGYHAQLNRLEAQIRELTTERDELRVKLAALQAREPVLLADSNILHIWSRVNGVGDEIVDNFARAIEQAVLKANGLMGE